MRDRTADLLNANQALSQLSYSPVSVFDNHELARQANWLQSRRCVATCINNTRAAQQRRVGTIGRPGQI